MNPKYNFFNSGKINNNMKIYNHIQISGSPKPKIRGRLNK